MGKKSGKKGGGKKGNKSKGGNQGNKKKQQSKAEDDVVEEGASEVVNVISEGTEPVNGTTVGAGEENGLQTNGEAKEIESTDKPDINVSRDDPQAKEDNAVAVESIEIVEEKKSETPEVTEEAEEPCIPHGLEASLHLLTENQQELAKSLCSSDAKQSHLFEHWRAPSKTSSPSAEASNNVKRRLMTQLELMDNTYPSGGLLGYISNAKELLAKSKSGLNPLDGWKPSVPQGEMFEVGTPEFDEAEKAGLREIGKCGFVLVAGGLGERLGYGDIKIGLPTELATETSYIQYYIETMLAYQAKYAEGKQLPLCIMTSGDTNAKTVTLLKKNNYFGLDEAQITLVQQGDGVPALEDNDAKIVLNPSDKYSVLTKPHGHGDIHALLHSHAVAKTWLANGIKWAVFFQDTNGLAFHPLPIALGVSAKLDLIMNSITVPRKAKQAIGAITLLKNQNGEEKTINVEYNQLDPLLRGSGFPDGDVNDENTGFSPYPGNINQLVFKLEPYVEILESTKGAMPEFVNPKYKDVEKTIFKKPTRLECMMQDFPTVLEGEYSKHVGFTSISANLCFSPVKNTIADGVVLQQKGTAPGVAASGEADQFAAIRTILTSIGCQVEDAAPEVFSGISVIPGPAVVLKPSFAVCPAEIKEKFTCPTAVKISKSSSLVVIGSGLLIESLDLDGALVIECEEGATGIIRDLVVRNKGWKKVIVKDSDDEIISMRGYKMDKIDTHKVLFKKDGTVEGLPSAEESPAKEIEEPRTESEPVSKAIPIKEPPAKEIEEPLTESELVSKAIPIKEPQAPEPKIENKIVSREVLDVSKPVAKDDSKECSCSIM